MSAVRMCLLSCGKVTVIVMRVDGGDEPVLTGVQWDECCVVCEHCCFKAFLMSWHIRSLS